MNKSKKILILLKDKKRKKEEKEEKRSLQNENRNISKNILTVIMLRRIIINVGLFSYILTIQIN